MERKDLAKIDQALTLIDRLEYREIVPDPAKPGFLMDPETGRRWRFLSREQEMIAEYIFEGSNYREAARKAGIKTSDPGTMSSYVSILLAKNQPFINYLIRLCTEARQNQTVTRESHLKRLADLSRRAEKDGKYSAAISAEIARGRVGGLYVNEHGETDKRVLNDLKDVESRIRELLEKGEREVKGRVVSDQ